MFRPDPETNHPGGDPTKKWESGQQPEGIGRCQGSLATQYAFDHAVLDSELDSLRHLSGPGAAGLHLG